MEVPVQENLNGNYIVFIVLAVFSYGVLDLLHSALLNTTDHCKGRESDAQTSPNEGDCAN
jgi:hypothetical protein